MTATIPGRIANRSIRVRHLIAATASLGALTVADPAWAQCATATAGGVTTLTCGSTVTTNTQNSNGNNPSTNAYFQNFANAIDATINAGATISGYGLYLRTTGANPITVTNNGTISNTTAQTIVVDATVDGLRIEGNGGAVTYLGNGTVTTNAVPNNSVAVGLVITNANSTINFGSQAAPITGTFRGEAAVDLSSGTGNVNAWIQGGLFEASQVEALGIFARGNVNLVMTGHAVLNGELFIGSSTNAGATTTVTTDAQVTTTLGPAVSIGGSIGGTNVTIANGASITGQAAGLALFSPGGDLRLTTAAGSTINGLASNVGSIGVQLNPTTGSGTVVADLGGAINAGGGGLFVRPANGSIAITIREGATVSGGQVGYTVVRINETGIIDVLNLGTISSPVQAASFDGMLRIGNGGTSGTISGNIANRGILTFNRSDAITYAQAISGTGQVVKAGQGVLTLSGASTFTGGTVVAQGTLNVTGSLAGEVIVGGNAQLAGTGSVGTVIMNGFLSPGGDGTIGTLTINGNLSFPFGSLRVDIGNGTNDRVNVKGTASLNGAVAAFASNSAFTAGSYLLLNAVGGISGTFSPLTTTPTAMASLRYDANNVFLDVTAAPGQSFTMSTRESLVFNAPTVTTNRTSAFSTQIIGRLLGGQPLYDQTFAAAFNTTTVQNGLTAARAAITNAGGPGVIIGDPVRTSTTTTSSTTSASTYALAGPGAVTTSSTTTFGPATIQIGALSTCNVASLPSATRPSCTTGGTSFTVADGTENFDTLTTTTYTINETRTDTTTDTLRETYELTGQVATIGMIHAEVQSGVLDLGSRLLDRLAAVQGGNQGWAEVYRFRVNQSGRRDAWGLAGGFGVAVAPGVTLGLGVDHGNLDIGVPDSDEEGDVELTELGAMLRVESGPFAASLAAVHGFGEAETLRTIIGASRADYDVRVTGGAIDVGYAMDAGGWTVRPVAGIDYLHLSTDAFAETDTLGLIAAEQDIDRVRASAGVEIGRDFGGISIAASARYLAVLSGDERGLPVAFAAAPGQLLDMTGPSEPDTLLVGARARIPLAPNAALSVSYGGRFGGGYDGHAAAAGISITW